MKWFKTHRGACIKTDDILYFVVIPEDIYGGIYLKTGQGFSIDKLDYEKLLRIFKLK